MQRDALVNGVLSFIIPGLGQGLRGNAQKGIMLFAGMLVVHAAMYYLANNAIGSLISTAYHLYAGYDAYINY